MKNVLFVLFFSLLLTACSNNNPKSDETEYFIEFRGFDGKLQKCLADKFINKWTSIDDFLQDNNGVAMYDEAKRVPMGKEVHIFRAFRVSLEDELPQKSQKIVIELNENRESFSVMVFQKEGDDWRRILNAGSFRTDLAELYAGDDAFSFAGEDENLCRFIVKIVVGLTYK